MPATARYLAEEAARSQIVLDGLPELLHGEHRAVHLLLGQPAAHELHQVCVQRQVLALELVRRLRLLQRKAFGLRKRREQVQDGFQRHARVAGARTLTSPVSGSTSRLRAPKSPRVERVFSRTAASGFTGCVQGWGA